MSNKKVYQMVTITQKYTAIMSIIEHKKTRKVVCLEYNVKPATICAYIKLKDKIINDYNRLQTNGDSKKLKQSKYPEIDQAL